MNTALELLFTPAEFALLPGRDLSGSTCVVFDILRATTSIVTALANGAESIIPVAEISEALAWRRSHPGLLLAGEREGLRIGSALTGGVEFDLGNSPREFTPERVSGRKVLMTTTNGTRALRACGGAGAVLIGSFLNLEAVARRIRQLQPQHLLVVCSGTFEQTAYEDILGAGALLERIWAQYGDGRVDDAAIAARQLYKTEEKDLPAALARSRNGARLLSRSELRDDVAFCLRQDTLTLCAELDPGSKLEVRKVEDLQQ